jgi:hypothetical protein
MARLEAGKGMEASIHKIAYGIAVLSMYATPVSYLTGGAIGSAPFIISLVLSMAWFGKEGLKSRLITNIAVDNARGPPDGQVPPRWAIGSPRSPRLNGGEPL